LLLDTKLFLRKTCHLPTIGFLSKQSLEEEKKRYLLRENNLMLAVKSLRRMYFKREKPKEMNYEICKIISGCPCKANLEICL
jgi:hypothetical protein